MKCQAMGEIDIDLKRCAATQTEIPAKFCEGCDWYEPKIAELAAPRQQNTSGSYVPAIYKVRIGHKLKAKLIEKAKDQGLQPAQYITKIIAEKLDNLI